MVGYGMGSTRKSDMVYTTHREREEKRIKAQSLHRFMSYVCALHLIQKYKDNFKAYDSSIVRKLFARHMGLPFAVYGEDTMYSKCALDELVKSHGDDINEWMSDIMEQRMSELSAPLMHAIEINEHPGCPNNIFNMLVGSLNEENPDLFQFTSSLLKDACCNYAADPAHNDFQCFGALPSDVVHKLSTDPYGQEVLFALYYPRMYGEIINYLSHVTRHGTPSQTLKAAYNNTYGYAMQFFGPSVLVVGMKKDDGLDVVDMLEINNDYEYMYDSDVHGYLIGLQSNSNPRWKDSESDCMDRQPAAYNPHIRDMRSIFARESFYPEDEYTSMIDEITLPDVNTSKVEKCMEHKAKYIDNMKFMCKALPDMFKNHVHQITALYDEIKYAELDEWHVKRKEFHNIYDFNTAKRISQHIYNALTNENVLNLSSLESELKYESLSGTALVEDSSVAFTHIIHEMTDMETVSTLYDAGYQNGAIDDVYDMYIQHLDTYDKSIHTLSNKVTKLLDMCANISATEGEKQSALYMYMYTLNEHMQNCFNSIHAFSRYVEHMLSECRSISNL